MKDAINGGTFTGLKTEYCATIRERSIIGLVAVMRRNVGPKGY